MIHFIRQTFGWMFLTTVLFIVTITFVTAIGTAWIWEHTVGILWQRRK
jgi:hypothetical protein